MRRFQIFFISFILYQCTGENSAEHRQSDVKKSSHLGAENKNSSRGCDIFLNDCPEQSGGGWLFQGEKIEGDSLEVFKNSKELLLANENIVVLDLKKWGTQVVAGVNYRFLATYQGAPKNSYIDYIVYQHFDKDSGLKLLSSKIRTIE